MTQLPPDANTAEPEQTPAETVAAGRRRVLKVAGAIALAGPVMETLTGKDLLTRSAQAQTVSGTGVDGPMTGFIGLV